jgi:A/G-specific adenine glycosylase
MSTESRRKTMDADRIAIPPQTARKIRRILLKWGQANYQDYPWRNANESWHALIAEILLQRTRAVNVVPVYKEFIKKFSIPVKLANARVSTIEKVIYPLGLRWRAPWLKRLGQELYNRNSNIPTAIEELKELPGVGDYVASAWLGFHGGKRAVIVDANVVRWLCRMIGQQYNGETRRQDWLIDLADYLTPPRTWKNYNYAVLDFTMKICSTHPKCALCPLGEQYCQFGRKQRLLSVKK